MRSPVAVTGRKADCEVFVEKFLEALNRPATVVLALAVLVAANALILYRYAPLPSTPSGMDTTIEQAGPAEETTPTETTVPEESFSYEDELGPFSPEISGMEERIEECETADNQESCITDLVAEVAPEAEYVGFRANLNIAGSGRTNRVLYYEDPALSTCEFTQQEFDGDEDRATYHTVVIAGQDTLGEDQDPECVGEF